MKSPILSSALKAICLTALLAVFCPAAEAADVRVGKERFNPSDSLDASYGLAGAFIGKIGSQVVLAGGSNFSKGMPWEGGAKQFSDRIHLISEKDGVLHTSLVSGNSLPTGTAHGCSATIGHTLFCFGGQTSEGASDKVLAIDEANGSVAVRTIGSLPSGLNPVAALAFKNDIFIHGISSEKNRLVKFTPATGGWKELTPCPGGPVSAGPSFEPQHNGSENAFYLIGGRHEGKETTTVHSDVWEYLPTSDTWSRKGDVTIGSRTVPIMFAASTPFGSGHILLIGGDTGEEFLRRDSLSRALGRARTETEKAAISNELREAFIGNKGFSKNILAYHTITNTWNLLSECDHSLPAVSTAVVLDRKSVV